MRVVVARAAHEGDTRDERPVAVSAHDLLGAEAVLDGHDHRVSETAGERACSFVEPSRLRRHDRDVELRQLRRIGGGVDAARELGAAGDLETLGLERPRVFGPARQDPDIGDAAQVSRVEAADHAGSDDAHTLDHEPAATAFRCCALKCGITVWAKSSCALIAFQ